MPLTVGGLSKRKKHYDWRRFPKEAHIQYISSSGLDARVPAFSLNVRHFCFKLVELAPSTYVDLGHCNTMSFRAVQTKNTMYFSA